MAENWTPASWKTKPALQQPAYRDAAALDRALTQLHALPPLVAAWEVLTLKRKLADAAAGGCFLLQGGDCAESFADCTAPIIANRLKVLMQMSLVLVHGRCCRWFGSAALPASTPSRARRIPKRATA